MAAVQESGDLEDRSIHVGVRTRCPDPNGRTIAGPGLAGVDEGEPADGALHLVQAPHGFTDERVERGRRWNGTDSRVVNAVGREQGPSDVPVVAAWPVDFEVVGEQDVAVQREPA